MRRANIAGFMAGIFKIGESRHAFQNGSMGQLPDSEISAQAANFKTKTQVSENSR